MWSGCGEGRGDGGLNQLRRHRLVAEPAHRSAQQLRLLPAHFQRFGGAEPEQVFLAGSQQLPSRRAVVDDVQPAHHGDRQGGQLALDQIGGRGDLVGHRNLGHHQLVAVRIDGTRIAVQHSQTGGTDGGVDLAVAPGPAHGVGDDDGNLDTQPLAQRGAQRRGTAVGIDWQERQFGPTDIGAVDAGGGLDESEPVLGDQRPALAGQHPHRLVVDQLAAKLIALLGILRRRHQPALAFGHHLAGDHHDVAVAQPGRSGRQRGSQIVAGPEFGKPGDGQDLDRGGGTVLGHGVTPASSSPARTISAVAVGSAISSGIARTATPSMSASSPSCTSQQSSTPVPRRAP